MTSSDGKFQIQRGEGISQAIAREIGLTKEQCKYVDWQSVFEKVKLAKGAEGNSVNWGGGDTLTKEYTGKNYVVNTGDEFVFSTDSWESIYNEVETSLKNKNKDVENLLKPESSVVSGIQDEQPEIVITEEEQDNIEQQAEIDSNEYDKKSRLSWGEIGTIACKSGKKFVKGLFCNKEGKFSIGRTAATVGVIVGCAVAAPLVAAGGAALLTAAGVTATTAATVANVAVGAAMLAPIAINGSKNAAYLALQIIANKHTDIKEKLLNDRKEMEKAALKANDEVASKYN